jgi:hypothetical protein
MAIGGEYSDVAKVHRALRRVTSVALQDGHLGPIAEITVDDNAWRLRPRRDDGDHRARHRENQTSAGHRAFASG